MKLIYTLLLSILLVTNSFGEVCGNTYKDIISIIEPFGWVVTSTTTGRHNTNSKHYRGKAVDVSVRNKSDFDIISITTLLQSAGYIVRDERTRPPLQRVWHGAHLHFAIPDCVEATEEPVND